VVLIHQRHRQTDGQTTALCIIVHRSVKILLLWRNCRVNRRIKVLEIATTMLISWKHNPWSSEDIEGVCKIRAVKTSIMSPRKRLYFRVGRFKWISFFLYGLFLLRGALWCKAQSCNCMSSVRLSVSLSVCDIGGSGPHRLKILETNGTNN